MKRSLYALLSFLPDKPYLSLMYRRKLGKRMDWRNPVTFTQKLQWLKVHDRNPLYTTLVDKAEVKDWVAGKIGAEHVIPTLGVWDRAEDIPFDALPAQFVLKPTHDSGALIICRDKAMLDTAAARRQLKEALNSSYYQVWREWPYRDVRPRIIAEKYMEQPGAEALTDYKLFCFGGKPRVILTVQGGHEDERRVVRRLYDAHWQLLPVGLHGKDAVTQPEPRPALLEEMLHLARVLSEGMRQVRVDFYVIGGQIYFGEMTFYHMSGFETFRPDAYDKLLGDMMEL